jgi:hypothetical protein
LDPLTFIAKALGGTAVIGLGLAFAAFVFWAGRRANIDFFVGLDPKIYQSVIAAGIVGGCIVAAKIVTSAVTFASSKLKTVLAGHLERRVARRTALKNLNSLPQEFAAALRFVKTNNLQRFGAPGDNDLLYLMRQAHLMEIDDPNWSAFAVHTYYVVPNHVWREIDKRLKDFPVRARPPWEDFRARL